MGPARGVLVFACGISLWIAARLLGSPTLHVVAVGLVALPVAATLFARRHRPDIAVHRSLSELRVRPGQRVRVDLDVENRAGSSTSFLLLEDRVPATLGPPARLVLTGIPGRNTQRVSYAFVPRTRGRYRIGPVVLEAADPFALAQRRIEVDERQDLIVTPEVEDLSGRAAAANAPGVGISRSRSLVRSGEEFYTMRAYREGDDLRRIHWPSVARVGELMIRQDETARRGTAVMLFDTRQSSIGQSHDPAFERCASVMASVGALLSRAGFSIRFGTASTPLIGMSEESLLDALAGVHHDMTRAISPALTRLRAAATGDATLVLVGAPPVGSELSTLVRSASGFGPKLGVLVYPIDPASLPGDRQNQLEARASQARLTLSRAGWDVLVLPPGRRLVDLWHTTRDRISAASV
jgi:uncharacterized protein (DUF58 family)